MRSSHSSRRAFLADLGRAAAAGSLALQFTSLATLAACFDSSPYRWFSASEARTMRAFASQIIPSGDGTAGAEEAGVVDFVDRTLIRPLYADAATTIRAGLADLDARARSLGARAGFASLHGAQQIHVMRDVERTPFFETARTMIIVGMFAEPSYGGNRNGSGWAMIGMQHQPSYAAPFGWYDAHDTGAA
jgi:gluconate 2-dehydrogenase gamma chain